MTEIFDQTIQQTRQLLSSLKIVKPEIIEAADSMLTLGIILEMRVGYLFKLSEYAIPFKV